MSANDHFHVTSASSLQLIAGLAAFGGDAGVPSAPQTEREVMNEKDVLYDFCLSPSC